MRIQRRADRDVATLLPDLDREAVSRAQLMTRIQCRPTERLWRHWRLFLNPSAQDRVLRRCWAGRLFSCTFLLTCLWWLRLCQRTTTSANLRRRPARDVWSPVLCTFSSGALLRLCVCPCRRCRPAKTTVRCLRCSRGCSSRQTSTCARIWIRPIVGCARIRIRPNVGRAPISNPLTSVLPTPCRKRRVSCLAQVLPGAER